MNSIFKQKYETIKSNFNSKEKWWKNAKFTFKKLTANKIVLGLIIFLIFASIMNPRILSFQNISGIIDNNASLGIMAIGMTFVILTAGIDLSVGSLVVLAATIMFSFHKSGVGMALAIIITMVLVSLVGLFQGMLIGYFKMAPFIVTLAGMLIFRGIGILELTPPIQFADDKILIWLSETKFLGLTIHIWLFIIISVIAFVILKFTIFGRNVYAVGGNKKAANLSGVNAKFIEMSVYGIVALLASIGTLLTLSNIPSATSDLGLSNELDVIAMVVIGGCSLTGGKGGVVGTIIGWLVLSILLNALLILGFSSAYQQIFSGSIILFAVFMDTSNVSVKNKIINLCSKFKRQSSNDVNNDGINEFKLDKKEKKANINDKNIYKNKIENGEKNEI